MPQEITVNLKPKGLVMASAQINTKVADFEGNIKKALQMWDDVDERGADLLVLPEQWVSGYPLEDRVLDHDLLAESKKALDLIVDLSKEHSAGITVGLPELGNDGSIYNAAYIVEKGQIVGKVQKRLLPNYDVFDEVRTYAAAKSSEPIMFRGVNIGLLICEDGWEPEVTADLAEQGAEMILSVNASPYMKHKHKNVRLPEVLEARTKEVKLPMLYVNQVGGQDEIVFDGASVAMNADQTIAMQRPAFVEDLSLVEFVPSEAGPGRLIGGEMQLLPENEFETMYQAAVVALRDYYDKIGFQKINIGISGGADSALAAAIAVDAVGAENVILSSLPTEFNSAETKSDAKAVAEALGVGFFEETPIQKAVEVIRGMLSRHFDKAQGDVWFENIQARLRGLYLMGVSNITPRCIMVSTGNKSEMAVGYATLYGDMNGAYNPLKDFYKTEVFELMRWRNRNHRNWMKGPEGEVMPESIIIRPPSAELGEGQVDTNSLPPYEILDPVLQSYIETNMPYEQIIQVAKRAIQDAGGYKKSAKETADHVIGLVDRAEFKRRQAPPGPKIQRSNFGKGRRMPISANGKLTYVGSVDRLRNSLA